MPADSGATTAIARKPRFALLLFLVVLVAVAIREHFVLATIIDVPIRGDIRDYVFYAWNLVNHGVFSSTPPQDLLPQPDSYRSPGYSWLLAMCMWLLPQGSQWYSLALQMQVLLGSATVLLSVLLARRWLRPSWAILAGLLLALWPHHVAATAALMPEVLFGFTLVAALYCFARGWERRQRPWFAGAGVAFACAFLVNPLVALFPAGLAMAMWLKRERVGAALLLAVFLLPAIALAWRNAQLDDRTRGTASRAAVNVVQGSWPLYHAAANRFRTGDRIAAEIMQEIDREAALLQRDPKAGLAAIANRLGHDPAGYAAWYLWQKPWLLWDWQIRVGASDLSIHKLRNSPFDTSPFLNLSMRALRTANPVLTLLTLAAAVGLLLFGWRRDAWVPAAATGALAAYFTLMHVLLQAEPRYAIAYRGLEAVLVATALAALTAAVARRRAAARIARTASDPM
jgi:4-amino-4-deoxy-L-arabinose transferase-like glycosyltransferase